MSFSEFTDKDYGQIEAEWTALRELSRGRCRTDNEFHLVEKAFDFANQAHKNIRRRSGAPYIIHPISVARIVIEEIGLGYKSICAALLHDVVEDTDYTLEDISNLFGEKISSLVDGLTKIKTVLDNEDKKKASHEFTESLQAENLKRILLTLNNDTRVVLIKLADRLHNCRTIEFMPEYKRDKILSETMFIFIPLAHRLGLYSVKSEMENIWLKFKEPDEYNAIMRRVSLSSEGRDKEIDEFIAPIREALTSSGHKFQIKKRIKTPYSVYNKMRTKKIPFEQIYDLYAVRIIYEPSDSDPDSERNEAYLIYAALLKLYADQPSRFRNWINQPKSNGYEALHCTLMSHSGFWIEVQIRSRRMDDIAEKGIAAHWAYKRNGYATENDSEMDRWLEKVQQILAGNDIGSLELLDIIHSDLISSDIVVFTPKGEQKSIQNGATVLDFAYMIHSHIGASAIAAKVNMKLVPLSRVLKAGDQVEIITAHNGKPKIEWLSFLHTRYARNLVIDYFRNDFNTLRKNGEDIYNERLNAMGIKGSNELLRRFQVFAQLNDTSELYFRIALGIIGAEDFRALLSSERKRGAADVSMHSPGDNGKRKYILADCCKPIPGDAIVGFLSDNDTVVVHKKSCPIAENLASKHGETVIVPEWDNPSHSFPVRVSFKGIDRLGLLNEVTYFISNTMGVNMRRVSIGSNEGLVEGFIELLVDSKDTLTSMLDGISRIEGIQDVVRTDI